MIFSRLSHSVLLHTDVEIITLIIVQLDQQSFNLKTKAPVVLAPTPVKHPQPTIQFLCWKDNVRSKNDLDSYDYVALQVQEMDLNLEESLLVDVWEFYMNVAMKREAKLKSRQQNNKHMIDASKLAFEFSDNYVDVLEKAATFLADDQVSKKLKKVYVRELILGYMKVNLSYFKSTKTTWVGPDLPNEVLLNDPSAQLINRYPAQSIADRLSQWSENTLVDNNVDGPLTHHVNINMISTVFPSISEAPIRFQGKMIQHVFETEGDILRSLQSYYAAETLRQIYKIVGSLDFVGNPTMVLSSFATGLRDFFLQPSRELKNITKNPSRVGVGVLKGTLSLFSNSTSGIFGFASNLGATFGHTATILTLDDHFKRLHSEQKALQKRYYDRMKKKGFGHVTMMVSRPFHDIAFGVLSASTGLLTEPYRGLKRDGAVGLVRGVAVGMIGVVVKPIVGLSDAFTHVMESIHDIAKSVNLLEAKFKPIERYRLPYVFGAKRILLPFNEIYSKSFLLLLSYPYDKKSKKGEEIIVASEALRMGQRLDQYIVVTTKRVALFKLKVCDGQGFISDNLAWQARFEKGFKIASSLGNRGHNGSILYVSRYSAETLGGVDRTDNSSVASHNKEPVEEHFQNKCIDFEQICESPVEDGRAPFVPETPKSFHSLGPTTTSFKLRAWPFGTAEGDGVTNFVVEGEFKHRTQLSRIHNAICCLSGDFDSVIHDCTQNRSEGITSFGPLIFERPQERPVSSAGRARSDLSILYSSLEFTSWYGLRQETPLFSEALSLSNREGGPMWLVEARARGMFVAPPPPPLPSNIDPAHDNVVSQLLSELESGLRTSDNAAQEIYSHARSLNFQKIKQGLMKNQRYLRNSLIGLAGNEADVTGDTLLSQNQISSSSGYSSLSANDSLKEAVPWSLDDCVPIHEQDAIQRKTKSQEGSDVCISTEDWVDLNNNVFPERNSVSLFKSARAPKILESSLNDKLAIIEETEGFLTYSDKDKIHPLTMDLRSCQIDSPSVSKKKELRARPFEESSMDERLRRVEAVLECLVPQPPNKGGSLLDAISGLHTPTFQLKEYEIPDSTQNQQNSSEDVISKHLVRSQSQLQGKDSEVQALLQEIYNLKKQLAVKDRMMNMHED